MKSGLVSGALSLIVFISAFLLRIAAPDDAAPATVPSGGAWKAFEWWYGQRAYPNALIAPGALARAHDAIRRIPRVKGGARTPASATSWESMGPDNIGGRVLAIAVHPLDGQTVFVGSASGGLWKTASGGTGPSAWTRIPINFPVLSVGAIAIDPLHPDTMYIGTGEISHYTRPLVGTVGARSSYGLGVLKSTDGGATWDTTGLNWSFQNVTAIQELAVNPLNPSTVFAATSEGVYRSTDGGDSWALSNPALMAMDLVINPADTSILVSSHGNLNSTPNPGIYRTTDAGGSWNKVTTGLPASNFGRTSLAISASDPQTIYAGIANGSSSQIIGLYRSTDAGSTWNQRSTTNYVGTQGWYDNVVAVDPADASTVYCAGFNIHKSTDGGTNLPAISGGQVHVDHHAIAFDPSDPSTVWFGTDGGIYKSTNAGSSFIDLNHGFLTTQFYPGFANARTDSMIALGGLQDNGTLKYIGTPSWIPVWGGDGGWCAIDPSNSAMLYAESQYGKIVRSYTGGGSFALVINGLPGSQSDWNFIPPFVMSPSAPTVLYAGSRNVYKTTNGGTTWFPSNGMTSLNGTNIACIGVSETSPDTLLAATGTGAYGVTPLFGVYASTNGGASWTNVTGPLPDRYPTDIEFDPSTPGSAYLTFSGYGTSHLFRTTNLGASWTDLGAGLPDLPHQCVAVDPVYPEYLYVGTDLGIFQSSDAGASWVPYNEGMPDAMVLDLTVSRSNDALRASTFGTGVYQRRLPRFSVISLVSPVGNEILVAGQVERIRWSQEYTSGVRLEFSADGGNAWDLIADSVDAATGYYDWTVPWVMTSLGIVKISNVDGGAPADSGLLPFSIIINPDVLGGWNIVSVPVVPGSYMKDSLFPTSISQAYGYDKGYQVRDTLSTGRGFWLKFPAPQFTDLTGEPLITDSVNLQPGWNIIGSVYAPILSGDIVERPPGILTSLLYEYRKGYSISDTIVPGRGYWVKAGSAGSIVLSSAPFPPLSADRNNPGPSGPPDPPRGPFMSRLAGAAVDGEHDGPAPLNSLCISDASGFSQTLYFTSGRPPAGSPPAELPPPAPGNAPDVRFGSDRIVEYFGAGGSPEHASAITAVRLKAPVRISWAVGETGTGYRLTGGTGLLAELAGRGTIVLGSPPDMLSLGRPEPDAGGAPSGFRLAQNYPNPFNPVTTISYILPAASIVRLAVFDNLGREVAVLADGAEAAGERRHVWNAASHASGVYFCRLTVDGKSFEKKMMLIR